MTAYPRILLAIAVVAMFAWIALADGLIDLQGKPLGSDFSNVYAAGKLTLEGTPEAAFDPARQHAAERDVFDGRDVPFYGWHYPPMFLFAAAALAMLPYGWALLVWMAFTLPLYLAAMRAIVPRPETTMLALAFPAVFVNLIHGQNGFLTAALLAGALLLMDRRPIVAGLLIGLLAYKPQFGVLIPLVLLATGRWQVIAAASVTVLATAGASYAVFGLESWMAFAESTGFTRSVVLEAGGTGWEKIQSAFSAVRMWGGDVGTAYAVQILIAVVVAVSLVWLWRSPAAFALKAAGLAVGSLMATPYVLDYDMVVLAVAIAFFAAHGLKHGFGPYQITLLAAVWITPLLTRSLGAALQLPVGFLAMAAFFALIMHRAVHDTAAPAIQEQNLAEL